MNSKTQKEIEINNPLKEAKAEIKVLVIDDEPGIRDLLSYELGSMGYNIQTAADGQEAIDQIKHDNFQLVISDIKMPKVDGLETLEYIKKYSPDTEVILATGYGTVETAVNAMKLGAYDFVQKPFNLNELFALIDKVLEKRELKTLVAIYEASKAVFSSIKLKDILPKILDLTSHILKADEVSIMLMDPNGKLQLEASLGQKDKLHQQARLELGERVAGKVALQKEPILITGTIDKDPRFKGVAALRDIKSSIVYPLVMQNQILGVLNANRITSDIPFTSLDVQNVTIFSSQIAQAVFNAKLYKEVEDKMKKLKEAYRQLEEAQKQLVQSEKLAAIGQLAAGVAHELNNPLTGILGFAQLILQEEDLSEQQREDMESIYKQSQRCRQIIQNLLQFSHRQEPKREPVLLAPIIDASLQLIHYDFTTSGIEIEKSVPSNLPKIFADPNQLQQVFLNLFTNARQAISEVKRSTGRISLDVKKEKDHIQIEFTDNGPGIGEGHIGKIFDPFFTTKPVGKGTGLGLSISYGIIQQHQGKISVESTKGEGATFFIKIPVYKGKNE